MRHGATQRPRRSQEIRVAHRSEALGKGRSDYALRSPTRTSLWCGPVDYPRRVGLLSLPPFPSPCLPPRILSYPRPGVLLPRLPWTLTQETSCSRVVPPPSSYAAALPRRIASLPRGGLDTIVSSPSNAQPPHDRVLHRSDSADRVTGALPVYFRGHPVSTTPESNRNLDTHRDRDQVHPSPFRTTPPPSYGSHPPPPSVPPSPSCHASAQ